MKILFIRHAEAVEREKWAGDDMSRPLTAKGRRTVAAMAEFLRLSDNLPKFVISSEASRAKETAAPFALKKKVQISPLLKPGCRLTTYRKLLKTNCARKFIAVVGHEPDFSEIIAALIGNGTAQIKMAKAACAIVELGDDCGRLLMLVSPAMTAKKLPMSGNKRCRKFQSLEE